ncbi:hypothetical protein BsWGS_10669 [Bradybaena similaris]
MSCPVLVLAVVLSTVQLSFKPGGVWCKLLNSNQDDDPSYQQSTADPFGLNESDNGSGDPEPTSLNTTVYPSEDRADTLPHLVVTDAEKKPCLLATLNATLQVSYRVPEGIVHEMYIALAEIQLPVDVRAQGVCGVNTTRLLLTWGHNNTFHVNITFTRHEPVTESANATWSLTALAVSYDLSNKAIFPGSSETDTVTVERSHLALFSTPVGHTHVCSQPVKIAVGPTDRGVLVNFHDVEIAAFGVTSSEFPPEVTVCSHDDDAHVEEEIIIPIIVACCLSAMVVIVVIAYVISRKVQASRDQSHYKQMP